MSFSTFHLILIHNMIIIILRETGFSMEKICLTKKDQLQIMDLTVAITPYLPSDWYIINSTPSIKVKASEKRINKV